MSSHMNGGAAFDGTLRAIRDRARIHNPPLYAYRVTDDELAALEAGLRGRVGRTGGLGRLEEAAFCLYGAEVFCRDHADGPWKWRTITDRLGVEYAARWLYPTIARGLTWWGRAVHRVGEANQYLVSLACEGGLPLELVRSRHTALGGYASRVLSDREAFGASAPTAEVARFHARRLPRTLRNDVVFALIAALVDALVELRRAIPDGVERPRAWLEQHHADWTDALPLRVDDEQSGALLDLLLGQPRGESTPGARISVQASLAYTTHEWRLTRALDVPRTLDTAELAEALSEIDSAFTADSLGPFVRFALVDVHGERHFVGEARQSFDGKRYVFESYGKALRGEAGPLELQVHVGPRIVARGTASGGGPMADEPWVFADGGERPLLGTGSLRTRSASVLVAVESDDRLDPAGDDPPEALGMVTNRRLVRVSGRWAFGEAGAAFVVQTRAADEQREIFDLRGSSLPLGPSSSPVWRGLPAVIHRPIGEPAREVPRRSLEISAGGRVWVPASARAVGVIRLRWVEGGVVHFMRRLQVAPEGLALEVRPGPGLREGRVMLDGVPGARLGVEPGDEFAVECSRTSAGVAAHIEWTGEHRPDTFAATLRLGPPHESDLALRLPFPVPFIGFVGLDGAPLARGAARRLDQLSTIRARVTAVRAGQDFGVWGRIGGDRWTYLAALRPERGYGHVLSLDAVREMLEVLQARTSDLDCVVEVTIRASGGTLRPDEPRLHVQRYSQTLVPSRDPAAPGRLLLTHHCAAGDRLVPPDRVDLKPLWSPETAPTVVEGEADAGWAFDEVEHEVGPWLVVGWRGDLAVTRPLLVTLGGDPEPSEDPHASLASLIRAPRPQRQAAMYGLLVELSADASSPKWAELRGMLAEVGTLPATTYDVVRGLIEHPGAMALAAIKMGDHPVFHDFWQGMERLPFIWSLVPIDVWLHAARSEQRRLMAEAEALAAALGADIVAELAARPLREFGETLGARRRAMRVMLEALHTAGVPVPEPAEPIMKVATLADGIPLLSTREAALQELLRTQAVDDTRDAYWPQLDASDFEAMVSALRAPEGAFASLRLDPRGRGYRQPVLDAPVIAAVAAAWNHRLRPDHVFALRVLRAFDERWFDDAYVFTLALALAERARREPEFLA